VVVGSKGGRFFSRLLGRLGLEVDSRSGFFASKAALMVHDSIFFLRYSKFQNILLWVRRVDGEMDRMYFRCIALLYTHVVDLQALLCFASLGSRELKERVRSFWFQRKERFDMSFIGSYVTEDAGRTMYSIPFSSPRESEEASMYLEIL
jgi:hypothetical protein